MMIRISIFSLLMISLIACGGTDEEQTAVAEIPETGIDFVDAMMDEYGHLGNYQFNFRGDQYTFKFEGEQYEYTKQMKNDSIDRKDILSNDGFVRFENGKEIEMADIEKDKFGASLNSVVYFACLPLKLYDPAVNMEDMGTAEIKGNDYYVLKVTFDAEGGGADYNDIFYYWINQRTHLMDFMAYSYHVNGGGVRFREAFNSRVVGDMRFQDYVNYKAPLDTPLERLPELFEAGKLKQISIIEVEDIVEI